MINLEYYLLEYEWIDRINNQAAIGVKKKKKHDGKLWFSLIRNWSNVVDSKAEFTDYIRCDINRIFTRSRTFFLTERGQAEMKQLWASQIQRH